MRSQLWFASSREGQCQPYEHVDHSDGSRGHNGRGLPVNDVHDQEDRTRCAHGRQEDARDEKLVPPLDAVALPQSLDAQGGHFGAELSELTKSGAPTGGRARR